jgi:hypothetical protein
MAEEGARVGWDDGAAVARMVAAGWPNATALNPHFPDSNGT